MTWLLLNYLLELERQKGLVTFHFPTFRTDNFLSGLLYLKFVQNSTYMYHHSGIVNEMPFTTTNTKLQENKVVQIKKFSVPYCQISSHLLTITR